MNEVTAYLNFRRALADYCQQANVPASIPEAFSWFERTERARSESREKLFAMISDPGELRCLYDLVGDLISDQLEEERYQEFLSTDVRH